MPSSFGGGALVSGLVQTGTSNLASGPFNAFTIAGNTLYQTGILGYEQTFFLYLLGAVGMDVVETARRSHGVVGDTKARDVYYISKINPDNKCDFYPRTGQVTVTPYDQFFRWNKPFPSNNELNVMFNRDYITEAFYRNSLIANASGERGIAQAQANLRFEIPGPSDLIHFAVRDCFDPTIVEKFQYNKELPNAILPYMKANGLHGELSINMPTGSTNTLGPDNRLHPQWFDLYWWSHWQLPSVTQGLEFLHRMYFVSPFGAAPGINANNQFTSADLQLLLKANDYPPFWRDKIEFVSYSPLTRVDVRRMYDIDVVNEIQVYHAYRAIGYNDQNATHLVNFTKRLKDEKVYKPIRTLYTKTLHEMFSLYAVDRAFVINNLRKVGYDDRAANTTADVWEIQRTKEEVKKMLGILRSGFLIGTLTTQDIRIGMNNLRLPMASINKYIQLWTFEKEGKRKFLSASTNISHYVMGAISRNKLISKLVNLNFDSDEIKEMVLVADYTIFQNRQKAMVQRAKEIAATNEKAIQLLLKPYTDANIKKWYKGNLMSANEVYKSLRLRGWNRIPSMNWMNTELQIDPEEIEIEEEEKPQEEEEGAENEN